MKFLVVLPLFVVASIAVPYVPYMPPGWATADTYDEFLEQVKEAYTGSRLKTSDYNKIASGTEAKKGENPEFCYLNIGFYSKLQVCGCWIYDMQYVVTSARCVVDCSEGMATNVTVNFPQLSGKDAIMKIEKIYVPDGTPQNSLAAYGDDGIPDHRNIAPGNIALIRLAAPIPKFTEMKDVKKAKFSATSYEEFLENHKKADGWKYRACGIGVIGNKGERAKGITCTDVNVVAAEDCKEMPQDQPFALPEDQLCIVWPDRDNNICVGDFGGPVYVYKPDAKDSTKIDLVTQEVMCTLVASPNVRSNAQCLDGHVTFCQMFVGADTPPSPTNSPAWVSAILRPPPPSKLLKR